MPEARIREQDVLGIIDLRLRGKSKLQVAVKLMRDHTRASGEERLLVLLARDSTRAGKGTFRSRGNSSPLLKRDEISAGLAELLASARRVMLR